MDESTTENSASQTIDVVDDFEEFCKNFTFLDTTTCTHCNGFNGPNYNQPVCISCHKFIFSIRNRKRRWDDQYRHSHHSHSRFEQHSPQMRDVNSFLEEMRDLWEMSEINERSARVGSFIRRNDAARTSATMWGMSNQLSETNTRVRSSVRSIDTATTSALSPPKRIETATVSGTMSSNSEYQSNTHISKLPAEILLKIFSYLKEKTLVNVIQVSKHWRQVSDIQQEKWKKLTMKRWPLLQRTTEPSSWLKMYLALKSSCCCRMCYEMMHKREDLFRSRMVRRRKAQLNLQEQYQLDGIKAAPLDETMIRWLGTIDGPKDSPYEGGKFFVFVYLPEDYPFVTPTLKFVTKIIHPNFSRHGDIGINYEDWNCTVLTINHMLLSIRSLFCDPYTKGCMEPELGHLYDNDRSRFNALARCFTKKYAMMNEVNFDD